ncbi:MAG TPA: glutathione S-transferase family protein [Steroidobacteraceae bacterium]|nr:glutathione S-transferase family protein [Steroidobacteraceae bacterium]
MLELYHHGSSACAAKVRLALAEKQLAWTGHYVDLLAGEQFRPEFLRINPKGVVPVLVHDGHVVRESTVICEYLEEVFPDHPVYPATPRERAQVRVWTKAVDEELHPACSTLTYVVSHRHTILRNGAGSFEDFLKQAAGEGQAARERKWRWIHEGLAAPGVGDQVRLYDGYLRQMNAALRDREWLVGDRLTMADIALAPYVNRLAQLSMHGMWQSGRHPRVDDWFRRISERPSFRSALLDWVPAALRGEMAENGRRSWPEVRSWLAGDLQPVK